MTDRDMPTQRTRREVLKLAAIAGGAGLMAACAPAGTAAPSATVAPTAATTATPAARRPLSPVAKVKFGTLPTAASSDAPIYIARDRGYYAEEGIEMEIVNFQTGNEAIVPLGNGTLDFAAIAVGAAAFNAIDRGVKIRLAADKAAHRPGFISIHLAIRKDLITSGQVKTWSDLKGRKISVPGAGNTAQVYADVALKRGGLTANDVEFVVLPFAETGVALANKSIDAGVVGEPFHTQWEAQNISARLPDTNDVYPGLQASVLVYGSGFVGEVADRFTLAYLRGIRDYLDAFTKGKDKEEIIGIMIKVTTLKDRALYDKIGLAGFSPDGFVNSKDLDAQQDFYVRTGTMPRRIDMAKAVDNTHCEYAVKQLGPYR